MRWFAKKVTAKDWPVRNGKAKNRIGGFRKQLKQNKTTQITRAPFRVKQIYVLLLFGDDRTFSITIFSSVG